MECAGESAETRPSYYVSHGRCRELDELGWERVSAGSASPPTFARYGCSLRSASARSARLRPFPFSVLGDLSDKCRFAEAAAGSSLAVPDTVRFEPPSRGAAEQCAAGLAARRPDIASAKGDIWYVKEAMASCQAGVCAFADGAELMRHLARRGRAAVVQKEVGPPHLIRGRKWVLRWHLALLPDMSRWVHADGVVCIHPAAYEDGCTDPEVQWQQRGAVRESLLGGAAGDLAPALWPQQLAAAAALCEIIGPAAQRAQSEARSAGCALYALLGVDMLVDAHLRAWVIEVNTHPWLGGNALGWGRSAQLAAAATFADFLRLGVLPYASGAAPQPGQWRRADLGTSPKRSPAAACRGAEWEVVDGHDAFGGRNAMTLPARTAGDIERCRAECARRGCGGFAVWRGRAYLRAPGGEECRAALRPCRGAIFHIAPGSAPSPQGRSAAPALRP